MKIASVFTSHMSALGKNYLADGRAHGMGASTDMGKLLLHLIVPDPAHITSGNVCYEVPGFHCSFSVGPEIPGASPHNPEFAIAAGTTSAFLNAMDCAKGMAMTAYELLANDDYAEEMWTEFRQEFGEAKA